MYTLYSITNKDGRIYYGRTRDFHNQLSLHDEFLKKNIHFNKLLQCVYNDYKYDPVFEIITESDDPKEITLECINLINEDKTYMAANGYNLFTDGSGLKSRFFNPLLYNEDIFFHYLKNGKTSTLKEFDISNNVLNYKLKTYGLLNQKKPLLSSYEEVYSYAQYVLFLNKGWLSSAQIFDRLNNHYQISKRLRITPHKIAKSFTGYKNIIKQKHSGFMKYKMI